MSERPFVCLWREQMADTGLSAITKLLLHTIALYFDGSGTGAYPSLDTLARRASLDRSTVKRHLRLAADWLDQDRGGGRGRATRYRAKIPAQTVRELNERLARCSADQAERAHAAPLSEIEKGALRAPTRPGTGQRGRRR